MRLGRLYMIFHWSPQFSYLLFSVRFVFIVEFNEKGESVASRLDW